MNPRTDIDRISASFWRFSEEEGDLQAVARATEHLIQALAADGSPVRRLRPPIARASLWLATATVLGGVLVYLFADLGVFIRRIEDEKLAVELVATFMTGLAAAVSAFELSLPDRSQKWMLLPLAPLALWIATSGYSCYRNWLSYGPGGWAIGESASCFAFIVAASIPLGGSLLLLLRRAAPIAPIPVAVTGGLSVAAIAAVALQFFHPFDVTFMDLSIHLLAIAVVVLAMVIADLFNAERSQATSRTLPR